MKKVEDVVNLVKNGEESREVLYGMIKNFLNYQEKKYSGYANGRSIEYGDIKSLVWMGVERAIETYSADKNCQFLTWAGVCIKYEFMKEYKKSKNREISLDVVSETGEEMSMEEIIADESALEPFEKAEAKLDGEKAMNGLMLLPELEREIVILTCIKNIPLAKAARGMGISRGHARTLRLSALKKLKAMILH